MTPSTDGCGVRANVPQFKNGAGTSSSGTIGPTNTALAVDPQVCLTYSHHSGLQPLANEPVTFSVMTGGGTVGGGSNATVNTGGDGCAHASWVLGGSTSLGGNTLRVTALAVGSPLTFTATGVVSPTGIPLSSQEMNPVP